MSREGLDPRAWLVWGAAAGLPSLLGRNPWPLVATLIAVAGVRIAWSDSLHGRASWTIFLRLAVVFAAVAALFNVVTVRTGDRVLLALPRAIPLLGGDVTLNAVVFGLLSGLALVLLVAVGTTVAGLVDWPTAVRLLPEGTTGLAVAGSVAFAFIPKTAVALREIREAQMARGYRPRGARDLLPIVVPLLEGGLDQALTLAAALESRGFGAPRRASARGDGARRIALSLALAGAAITAYLFAVGRLASAAAIGAASLGLVALALFGRARPAIRPTRYRPVRWTLRDSVVVAGSGASMVLLALVLSRTPAGLRYEPYPNLEAPVVSLLAIVAGLLLLTPAAVAPIAVEPAS